MTYRLIGLGKLLKTMYARKGARRSLLRADAVNEKRKAAGVEKEGGGDFYVPFWADAKRHVAGELDLREVTPVRIAANDARRRLYPALTAGFLQWWEERRRLRNVPFRLIESNIKSRFSVDGLGVVKVENTLAITVGDDGHRVIYPYFCDDPALSDEAAKLGLWVMSQCVRGYASDDMRLLDVFAGRSFSHGDTPLDGGEEQLFKKRYAELLEEWEAIGREL